MSSSARLSRTVVALGVVSLATDASSEMIYPLLPLFLAETLGAAPAMLGLIEGAAESTSALLKLVSGRLTDRMRRRKPLVVGGYTLSSLARPLIALASAPWMVLCVRLIDRVGKGLRSSPRDALLADATPPDQRGRAFGFHRAMDNLGAVIGPALGATLLAGGASLRTIFACAALPGAVALFVLATRVADTAHAPAAPAETREGPLPPRLKRYFGVLVLFALANTSDAFLLLHARSLGVPPSRVAALWMLHNAVRAALATFGGALSDRVGRARLISVGWIFYALVYVGFAHASVEWHAWALFAAYGLYYALVEGAEKALVAELAPAAARGRAFGIYHAIVGVFALPASLAFGWWSQQRGAALPLMACAALAALAAVLLRLVSVAPRPAAPRP